MPASPIKSPSHKRSKADEGVAETEDDDIKPPAPPPWHGRSEGSSPANAPAVTLGAIREILKEELSTVTQSVERLTQDLNSFKSKMNEELLTMGLRVKTVEDRASSVCEQVKVLEKTVKDLQIDVQQKNVTPAPESLTVVIGNVPEAASLDDARKWIQKLCSTHSIPQPAEIFAKGEYKGLAFAKCTSASQRELLISAVRQITTSSGAKPWAKIDLPVDKRTAESVLFAFKRMLVEWNYDKAAIKIDTDTCSLKVGGTEVLRTRVENFTLHTQWCDGEWEQWEELQSAPELASLKTNAQEKLDRARVGGVGKGKAKGSAQQ